MTTCQNCGVHYYEDESDADMFESFCSSLCEDEFYDEEYSWYDEDIWP